MQIPTYKIKKIPTYFLQQQKRNFLYFDEKPFPGTHVYGNLIPENPFSAFDGLIYKHSVHESVPILCYRQTNSTIFVKIRAELDIAKCYTNLDLSSKTPDTKPQLRASEAESFLAV